MQGPQKRQTPLAGGASQTANQVSAAQIVGAEARDDKRIATLKAALALSRFVVHETATGGWLVARWDRSQYCARVEELEAFLIRIGGRV